MDACVFDKRKLPSRHVTAGPSRAPHRSYLYAMGLTREQIHQAVGGPIALVRDGGIISLDAIVATLTVALSDVELAERRKHWKPRTADYGSGAIWKYAQTGGSAKDGAVTHPGFAGETHVYADL